MVSIFYWLKQKQVLITLLVINVLGTAYGFYWYKWQLAETPPRFWAFVPDSPTASLFFVAVLIAFLLKKHLPLLEALAAVSLFKYGVWAVGMNIAGGFVTGSLTGTNCLLIFSHSGMALEGLLFMPFYRIKPWHLVIASIWVLHDLMIDYVFGMIPDYPVLYGYESIIGYWTFWLTLLSIYLTYLLAVRKNHLRLDLSAE
ncbi:MAG TPA: DUF1405 domain-containing protein [Bacillales bacterium]|nr:DUF1405 domain-containing protein [Bacillales bacterium]